MSLVAKAAKGTVRFGLRLVMRIIGGLVFLAILLSAIYYIGVAPNVSVLPQDPLNIKPATASVLTSVRDTTDAVFGSGTFENIPWLGTWAENFIREQQIQAAVDALASAAAGALPDSVGSTAATITGSTGIIENIATQVATNIGGTISDALSTESARSSSTPAIANQTYAADYLQWRSEISTPVERLFAGTGIDATLIEGIAGGSVTAISTLATLPDSTLSTIYTNATNLSRTAAYHSISASLPADVQSAMHNADSSVQTFAAEVQELITAVRSVNNGSLLSITAVTDHAGKAFAALQSLDASLASAEEILSTAL